MVSISVCTFFVPAHTVFVLYCYVYMYSFIIVSLDSYFTLHCQGNNISSRRKLITPLLPRDTYMGYSTSLPSFKPPPPQKPQIMDYPCAIAPGSLLEKYGHFESLPLLFVMINRLLIWFVSAPVKNLVL